MADGHTVIHLARDHGLRIEGGRATEVFSMWRTYEGGERFAIHTHATTAGEQGAWPGGAEGGAQHAVPAPANGPGT